MSKLRTGYDGRKLLRSPRFSYQGQRMKGQREIREGDLFMVTGKTSKSLLHIC